MEINTKYITLDDFKGYTGKDLVELLGSTEAANSFLARVEIRMEAFLEARMHQNISLRYPHFTDSQKMHYKFALLEQADYITRVGEISKDSGYDPDSGLKIDQGSLISLAIDRNAKEQLMLAGVWTYKVNPYGFLWDFLDWGR